VKNSFNPLNRYLARAISCMSALAFVFILTAFGPELISNKIIQGVCGFVSGGLSVALYKSMFYRLTK
jgi:hypothetical protein